jgi:signal transduction histidine kinase
LDSLITANACLAGAFTFAAIHYAFQWWLSRNERVLLVFSLLCGVYGAFCFAINSFFRATTIADSQAALDHFVTLGVLGHAVMVHFYAGLGGRRDQVFRALVTAAFACLAVLNLWAPLRGTVVELQPMRLPGGGTGLLAVRTPPGAPLAFLYLVVVVSQGYGLSVARDIWKRDRAGATLLALGAAAVLGAALLGVLVDFAHVRAPYAGAWPLAFFVLCVALVLSRESAAREARAAASERARQVALQALVLAQRTELASQLAAGVAHDFNNVLSVISTWSEVMLSQSRLGPDEEKARRALSHAQQQGQALSRRLMSLARPDARTVTRFPLERPIRATLQALTPSMPPETQLRFAASAAPWVDADEAEIEQVIYNLVLNARDAMRDGGTIQLAAALETTSVPIDVVGGSLAAGRWATLTVSDSGPGIAPANRERIFDLFFTTKTPGHGTGLGLATVLRIAKISGGGVLLTSEPGQGATFKIYLPCA